MPKPRLELTWVGKDKRPLLEPRILIEDLEKSYHSKHRVTEHDQFDNRLIFGDNLLALKALEQEFTGKVKCIYVDPPFNTGAAFEHYDDGLEHSVWLDLMADRLELLRRLLSNDGCLFVHLDDNELDYLKVVLDELFGRPQFMGRITIKARSPSAFSTVNPGVFKASEYLLWYARDKTQFSHRPVRVRRRVDKAYKIWLKNPEAPYTDWEFGSVKDAFAEHLSTVRRRRGQRVSTLFESFVVENAHRILRHTAISDSGAGEQTVQAKAASLASPGRILKVDRVGYDPQYIVNGQQLAFYSKNIAWLDGERVPTSPLTNIWVDIAWEGIAKEGGVRFKKGKKPERLIKRCIELATDRGDLVLDSFAGSGTTGAVAHKMGRRWIMVELGEHCHTHIIPRMRKVIDGQDPSGITKAVDWQGGGGFRYYRLAPSLMEQDTWGNWVISKEYNAAMLAEAVCKLEGFRYEPSAEEYWLHGRSTEQDFVYVTTQTLTEAQLNQLSLDVGGNRTLLVCCSAFRGRADGWENLTLKKIPQAVLSKCEWGQDDYSLEIRDLPAAPREDPEQRALFEEDDR